MKKNVKIVIFIIAMLIATLILLFVFSDDKKTNNESNNTTNNTVNNAIADSENVIDDNISQKTKNEVIKEALEDKGWLRSNIMIRGNISQTVTFIKLNVENDIQIITEAKDSTSTRGQISLVYYNNGEAQANMIFEKNVNSTLKIDPNTNIIEITTGPYMGTISHAYYKITNKSAVFLDAVSGPAEAQDVQEYYKCTDSIQTYVQSTKTEVEGIITSYENQNKFVQITAELNEENINKMFTE